MFDSSEIIRFAFAVAVLVLVRIDNCSVDVDDDDDAMAPSFSDVCNVWANMVMMEFVVTRRDAMLEGCVLCRRCVQSVY